MLLSVSASLLEATLLLSVPTIAGKRLTFGKDLTYVLFTYKFFHLFSHNRSTDTSSLSTVTQRYLMLLILFH